MKKILIIFLGLVICSVSSYTSVHATEVVIGNNVTIGSEDEYELGTKIALLTLLPDLLMDGNSDVTITSNGSQSLDDYLLDLYGQICEYSDEGLQDLKSYVDDKASEFVLWAQTYEDPIVDGALNSFFTNGNYKTDYHKGNVTGLLERLSRKQSSGSSPSPQPPSDYAQYIEIINGQGFNNWFNYCNVINYGVNITPRNWTKDYSFWFYGASYMSNKNYITAKLDWNNVCASDIYDLYIYSNNGQYSYNIVIPRLHNLFIRYNYNTYLNDGHGYTYQGQFTYKSDATNIAPPSWSQTFDSLEALFKHLSACVHNVNIYVDNIPWSIVGETQSPILSTGGLTVIRETIQPVSYYFSEPVQIDYQKLYELMVRAFQNGQPIDMTTINQGDVFINSNNTTIAPQADVDINIDNPLDGDFIGTLVGVMALPSFNSDMVQPLMQHVGSATVIATTYTSAIPSDIIEILGACLVISLFICIMHRMLE